MGRCGRVAVGALSLLLASTTAFTIGPQEMRPVSMALSAERRRDFLVGGVASLFLPTLAVAVEEDPVALAFDRVQTETSEGVSFLTDCLEQGNYDAMLEFTKNYDQILRKGAMGKAKKFIEDKDRATALANSVTFDLIGINKAVRPNQRNPDRAKQYIQELQDDVQAFIALKPQ